MEIDKFLKDFSEKPLGTKNEAVQPKEAKKEDKKPE